MYTYVQLEADRAGARDGSAGANMPLHRAVLGVAPWKQAGVLPACFQVNQARSCFHNRRL